MKEIASIAANLFTSHTANEEAVSCDVPQIEVVLIVSEPVYKFFDLEGGKQELRKVREATHFRFCGTPRQLRQMADKLNEFAYEREHMAKEVTAA
ncbi:MAG: hypothetical protein JWO08_1177 [Verrucomicrobiaceae bacterium]|nr:hypothetical protein [Verrucomicrobiaceae bacterium]